MIVLYVVCNSNHKYINTKPQRILYSSYFISCIYYQYYISMNMVVSFSEFITHYYDNDKTFFVD